MASHVSAIAIEEDGTVFVGTFREGVFRSTDDGESWIGLGLTATNIRSMVIDKDHRLFVATWGNGVYRSSDRGETWMETNIGLLDPRVQSLSTDDSGTVLAGTFAAGVFALDGGIAWRPASEGLTDLNIRAVSVNWRGVSFAAGRSGVVSVSHDYGRSWTRTEGVFPLGDLRNMITYQNGVFVAGWVGGVARTYMGEGTWERIDEGLANDKVWSLLVTPDGRLLAGTHGNGVYEWNEGSSSWSRLGLDGNIVSALHSGRNGAIWLGARTGIYRATGDATDWRLLGIPRSYVYSLAHTDAGTVVAATYESGLLRREAGDSDWTPSSRHYETVFSVVSDGPRLLAGGVFGRVFESTDDGQNWTEINKKSGDEKIRAGIYSLFVDGDHVYAGSGGDGLLRSLDGGATWSRAGLDNRYVLAITTDASGTAFAGTDAGIFRSTTGTDPWEDITTDLTALGVYALYADPAEGLYAGTQDGVVRSIDGGETWDHAGVSGTWVLCIHRSQSEVLYVGTEASGIFIRPTAGASWLPANHGLYNLSVHSFDFIRGEDGSDQIFAATFGDGVFSAAVPTGTVDGVQAPVSLLQAETYPNPFGVSTNITFSTERPSQTRLTVYDVQGRRVTTILDRLLPAGDHSVAWKPQGLPSGIYYYALTSGTQRISGTLVHLR